MKGIKIRSDDIATVEVWRGDVKLFQQIIQMRGFDGGDPVDATMASQEIFAKCVRSVGFRINRSEKRGLVFTIWLGADE